MSKPEPAAFWIRPAQPAELDLLCSLEAAGWPATLAAGRDALASRLAAAPELQLVAVVDRPAASATGPDVQLAGYAAAQRVSSEFFAAAHSRYATLTDRGTLAASHAANGPIYHLVGVCVAPEFQGLGLARQLVDAQIAQARRTPGIQRILGVTRPVRYGRHAPMPLADYVAWRGATGRLVDPVLSFHLDHGARLLELLPDFRPPDQETCGQGVLIEYPLTPDDGG